MTAVRFCVAHSTAYDEIKIDKDAARVQFQNLVPDVVLAQAVAVDVTQPSEFIATGPGETGGLTKVLP